MTVTELPERLNLYLDAEKNILGGNQSWSVGNRSFTKGDLAEIRRTIESLRRGLYIARNGGSFGCSQVVIGGRSMSIATKAYNAEPLSVPGCSRLFLPVELPGTAPAATCTGAILPVRQYTCCASKSFHVMPDTILTDLGHDLVKLESFHGYMYSVGKHPLTTGQLGRN